MTPEIAALVTKIRAVAEHLEQDPHGNPVEAAVNRHRARAVRDAAAVIESLNAAYQSADNDRTQFCHALADMLAGWKYIRAYHGDLPGVGWGRAQSKAEAAFDSAGINPLEYLAKGGKDDVRT